MSATVQEVTFRSEGFTLYGRRRDLGAGTPCVVLLCGIGFHTFEYEPLARHLAERGIGSLAFDYRCHGRSNGPRGDWRLAGLCADAAAAIAVADPGEHPVHLFGNSLGAMVALRAGDRPEVAGVVAANAPARIADFMLTRARRMLLRVADPVSRVIPVRIGLHHFYDYGDLLEDPQWLATIRADPRIGPARRLTIATYRDLLDGWDGAAAVRGLSRPLLVVNGSRDRFQPPEQTEQLLRAAGPAVRHETLDTGHLPHLDDPAAVADLLSRWL